MDARSNESGTNNLNPIVVRPFKPGNPCIYILGSHVLGIAKIGFTTNILARYQSIQLCCPFPLEVLATFPGKRIEERRIHLKFKNSKFFGEWFCLTEDVKSFIASLKDRFACGGNFKFRDIKTVGRRFSWQSLLKNKVA